MISNGLKLSKTNGIKNQNDTNGLNTEDRKPVVKLNSCDE
jgi:hypothetical protein